MKSNIKRVLVLSLIIAFSQNLLAQKIDLNFPVNANKKFTFVLNKGINQDTIQQGTFNFMGSATINIPEKYKTYFGMGVLTVDGQSSRFFVVKNESFSVVEVNKTIQISGSDDNKYFYAAIQNQELPEVQSNFYSPFFLEILQYVQLQNRVLDQGAAPNDINRLLEYAITQLDVEKLYTSGMWFFVIDNMVKLESSQDMFANDMIKILKRTTSQTVFEALASDLIMITEQFALDDATDIIIPYLKNSGRIKNPQGRMFDAFVASRLIKGMIAPSLQGNKKDKKVSIPEKTLVIFYDPDCHSCEAQLDILIKDYSKLVEHKIQVISVSSTDLESAHKKDQTRFPWSNCLCDFKGLSGNNFKNYGVLSTPTIFLLDKNNKVLGKYALLSAIKDLYN